MYTFQFSALATLISVRTNSDIQVLVLMCPSLGQDFSRDIPMMYSLVEIT